MTSPATYGSSQSPGLSQLLEQIGCSNLPAELIAIVLTHKSAIQESYLPRHEEAALISLSAYLEAVGKQAYETAMLEYFLREQKLAEPWEAINLKTSISDGVTNDIASRLDLRSRIKLGKGEEKTGGRDKSTTVFRTTMRLLGAIMMTDSYEKTRDMIVSSIRRTIPTASSLAGDTKSFLAAVCQRQFGRTPMYEILSTEGPEHDLVFRCRVTLPDRKRVEGSGHGKKAAAQDAARNAIVECRLLSRFPEYARLFFPRFGVPSAVRGLDSNSLRPPPQQLPKAKALSTKLACDDVDPVQLAVALTMSKRVETDFDTNVRHITLGGALEKLAFYAYAFEGVPLSAGGSIGLNLFEAEILSDSAHAALFDLLGLEKMVFTGQLTYHSDQKKADSFLRHFSFFLPESLKFDGKIYTVEGVILRGCGLVHPFATLVLSVPVCTGHVIFAGRSASPVDMYPLVEVKAASANNQALYHIYDKVVDGNIRHTHVPAID